MEGRLPVGQEPRSRCSPRTRTPGPRRSSPTRSTSLPSATPMPSACKAEGRIPVLAERPARARCSGAGTWQGGAVRQQGGPPGLRLCGGPPGSDRRLLVRHRRRDLRQHPAAVGPQLHRDQHLQRLDRAAALAKAGELLDSAGWMVGADGIRVAQGVAGVDGRHQVLGPGALRGQLAGSRVQHAAAPVHAEGGRRRHPAAEVRPGSVLGRRGGRQVHRCTTVAPAPPAPRTCTSTGSARAAA